MDGWRSREVLRYARANGSAVPKLLQAWSTHPLAATLTAIRLLVGVHLKRFAARLASPAGRREDIERTLRQFSLRICAFRSLAEPRWVEKRSEPFATESFRAGSALLVWAVVPVAIVL
jgi:hypothetical protein